MKMNINQNLCGLYTLLNALSALVLFSYSSLLYYFSVFYNLPDIYKYIKS